MKEIAYLLKIDSFTGTSEDFAYFVERTISRNTF